VHEAQADVGEPTTVFVAAGIAEFTPPCVRDPLLALVLRRVTATPGSSERAFAVRLLAPRLTEPLLPEAVALAAAMGDEYQRAEALRALAPRLPEPLLREATAMAAQITSGAWRERAIAALACRLAVLRHPDEALELVEKAAAFTALEFVELIPHLPALARVLAQVKQFEPWREHEAAVGPVA
jgi:hypothetical protein